jgi:hypothetical protein
MNHLDQCTCDFGALNAMFRKVYWGQIFSRKTTWEVKKIAIQSLWYMRRIFK